ncbi:MAG: translocation/assembly module TamB domain-containing protein [Treponema sp.]|nr:translocation/assembly module TamB domain-containing protein [Treponema sp.]
MADFTNKNKNKHISRSILLQICVFLSLIFISIPLLRPVQAAISGEILNIRKNYIEKIEILTGREITYSSIRLSLFGSIDVRNLKMLYKNPGNSAEDFLSISRLKFSFSLLKLLRGNKSAIKTVLIDRPLLNLDSKRDIDIYRRLSSSMSGNDSGKTGVLKIIAQYLPKEPELIIRGGSLRLYDDSAVYQILALNIGITGNENGITLDGKFNAYYYKSSFFNRTAGARSSVIINGSCSSNLENARAQITLESFADIDQSKLSAVLEPAAGNSINTGLNLNGGILSLYALGENLPYNYSFYYHMDSGYMDILISCSEFKPGELVAFTGDIPEANQLLSQTVSGNASFNYINGEEFKFDIDFSGIDHINIKNFFTVQINGGARMINIDNFKIAASPFKAGGNLFRGSLSLDGNINPGDVSARGNIFIKNFSLNDSSDFDAFLRISSTGNEIRILSDTVSFAGTKLTKFDMKVFPSSGNTGVTLLAACGNGVLNLDSTINRSPGQLETSISLDSFSIADITRIIKPFVREFNIPEAVNYYSEKTLVNTEIFFSTNFNQFMYNAPDIKIKYSENNEIDTLICISLSGTDRLFNLNEGLISRNGKDMRVSSLINFSNPNDLSFSVNADYQDTFWQIEGQVLDKSSFTLHSSNGLQGYGNKSPSGAVSGYIEAVNFPLIINENIANSDFNISVRFENHNIWWLDIARMECRDFFPKFNKSLLRFSGNADQSGIRITDVFYNDDLSSLEGSISSSWKPDFSNINVYLNLSDIKTLDTNTAGNSKTPLISNSNEVVTVIPQGANEFYILEGAFENNHLELSASVKGMRLDRFLNESAYALLDARMKVSWDSISQFQADIDLSSLYIRTRNNTIRSSASMLLNNDDLLIYNVNADYSGLAVNVSEFHISRLDNTARAYADLEGIFLGRKLVSRLILDARFARIDSWYQMRKSLNSFESVINIENLVYGDTFSQQPFKISLVRDYNEFSILGGPKNMFRLEMDNEGDFFACVSSPSPVHATITGRFYDNFIDAGLNELYIDLQALWSLAPPIPVIELTGGYITGNLDIRGPVSNPLFSGSAKGSSVKLFIPGFVRQEIICVPFNISVENNEINFGPVLSKSGSGGGAINAQINIQQWLPSNLALDITVPKESPIPYQFNIVNFVSGGEASGKMNIRFDSSGLDIKGDLFTNNTEMSLANDNVLTVNTVSVNKAGSIRADIPITADITIITGPSVEFVWPNTRFPILTASPEIGTVFKVYADTGTGQYSLRGDIKIRSGEIYYFDRNFYIKQGTLVFRENEREFNPRLSARAEIRDRTNSGPVTISMIIDNEPLLKFTPRFESSPALTQLEIYSILGQNSIQVMEDAGMAQRFFLNSTADILSQFIRVRQLEKQVRNFLHMDMFSVRTQFLQNVAMSATGLGQPLVDTNYSIGNYLDNTTFFIGKYVGQDMFVQGMFSLKYDRNAASFYGLRAEPDIGIELQSPLGNIRWNLLGFWDYGLKIENSISLTWKFNF